MIPKGEKLVCASMGCKYVLHTSYFVLLFYISYPVNTFYLYRRCLPNVLSSSRGRLLAPGFEIRSLMMMITRLASFRELDLCFKWFQVKLPWLEDGWTRATMTYLYGGWRTMMMILHMYTMYSKYHINEATMMMIEQEHEEAQESHLAEASTWSLTRTEDQDQDSSSSTKICAKARLDFGRRFYLLF